MYLAHLQLSNGKLLRDFKRDFLRGGEPRMWTVFVGENGLCEATLLQAMAIAASGFERAPDRMAPGVALPGPSR